MCAGTLLAGAAAAAYFELHHQSLAVSAETANAEFDRLRARFAGQRPLVDMEARQAVDVPPSPVTASVRSFHTVIFDTRGGTPRLIHLTAPPLFARAFAHRDGHFRWLGELTFLDDTEFDPEPIQLSFEAIKRRGPGLLVDYRHPGGGQFLAWVE